MAQQFPTWGPRPPLRRRRVGRRRRAAYAATGALLALLLLAGAAAGALYLRFDGNISEIDIDAALGTDRPEDEPGESLDILVLGSDSREGENEVYGRQQGGPRADTAMVVHLAEDRRGGTVVSIPRDTLVHRPACRDADGEEVPAADRVMFNEAFAVGGPVCAVKTAEAMTGVRMDHYVEVDFRGFEKMIDALGGVEVSLDRPLRDPDSHLDLAAGDHRLDGETALALVRTRKSLGDGSDLERIQLQHSFIRALAQEVRNVGVVGDPRRLYRLADTATGAVTTDSALASVSELTALARRLGDVEPERLQTVTLPVGYDRADPNRVVPLEPQATGVWDALRADVPVPEHLTEGSDAEPGGEAEPPALSG
ncbi:LCP family protein [Streptomyces bohaiensis]|uniref:LytR family transcriptional regulator n=1 Tax=Streptomyces bohaiensis TaxID=1431344 RepID=A0ABX1C8W1_9ACTN|nr:LCP family protein [Streptomyces bohaiensis]NJQ13782.1 LytR family transcriptional regulator [Streptomyces bohaiensis]